MSDYGTCSHCGFPLHRDDSKRHYGTHTAHQENRCLELLQAALAAERAEKDAEIAMRKAHAAHVERELSKAEARAERAEAERDEAQQRCIPQNVVTEFIHDARIGQFVRRRLAENSDAWGVYITRAEVRDIDAEGGGNG